MLCPNCGREMPVMAAGAPHCLNVSCSSRQWRNPSRANLNIIELIPSVALDPGAEGRFVGSLYLKEIRFVEDCECFGASMSRVAVGQDAEGVRQRTAAEAKNRASFYESRGYKVTLRALSFPGSRCPNHKRPKNRAPAAAGTAA